MKAAWMSCLMALWAPSAFANASEPESARGEQAQIYQRTQLIAGTPIPLEMAQTVTTQGGSWKEDDMFNMIVSEDVAIGEYVVIPRGTLAVGHVRWATGRGAFGKSGKIEVSVDHLVLGGRKIRLSGVHRKEGRGECTTTGRVASAGPFAAALIPGGKLAEIAQRVSIEPLILQKISCRDSLTIKQNAGRPVLTRPWFAPPPDFRFAEAFKP